MTSRLFIVTGGNKGIGFETARKLCNELKDKDAIVLITSRCPKRGNEAINKLAEEGLNAKMEELDITKEESLKRFVETVETKYGNVDCLVNNAGFAFKTSATEPMGVQAKVTCDINYYGTRDLTMLMRPLFKPDSRVVNVASMAGERALGQMTEERRNRLMKSETLQEIDQVVHEFVQACEKNELDGWPKTAYGFSKAAVIALTALSARLSEKCPLKKDMIITCCCPGWCKSDMAGWDAPPLSATDGAEVIVPLALRSTKEHHGKFIKDGKIIDLTQALDSC